MKTYIIQDKQQFKQYQQDFRALSSSKEATAEDHILYNLIRGKDLKRGFTPITNERKLNADYYRHEWRTFERALSNLKHQIKNREREKQWFEKYGGQAPLHMRYGNSLPETIWDEILSYFTD